MYSNLTTNCQKYIALMDMNHVILIGMWIS